jgi:hypothetical protein
MKPVVGPLVAAILFAVIGGAFWIVGQTDRRIADVHAQLATLQYAAAATSGEGVDQLLTFERRVPVVGPAASTDVRDARAAAAYWRTDYPSIAPNHDANGVVAESDPAILLLAANAAYRASQGTTDRNEMVRRLDNVVKSYGEVLKTQSAGCGGPGQQACEARAMDAAYNYEFAIRTREAIARPRPGTAMRNPLRPAPKGAADETNADLPAGPTLHGAPGGPPPAVDMNQFKIVIPKRGEERKDAPDAGKGGAKIRKG